MNTEIKIDSPYGVDGTWLEKKLMVLRRECNSINSDRIELSIFEGNSSLNMKVDLDELTHALRQLNA